MSGRVSVRSAIATIIGGLARRALEIPAEKLPEDPHSLKLAEDFLELVGLDNRASPVRIDRRGRPRTHDMEFAKIALAGLAMASPDGLPARQWILAGRLRARFEEAGKPVPGNTWLSKVTGQFYASFNRMVHDAMSRYRGSADLQKTFGTEEAYVEYRTADFYQTSITSKEVP